MSGELERLVDRARRHVSHPTSSQRTGMKRAIMATAAVAAGGASGLTMVKLVLGAGIAAAVGGAATAGIVHLVRPSPPPAAVRQFHAPAAVPHSRPPPSVEDAAPPPHPLPPTPQAMAPPIERAPALRPAPRPSAPPATQAIQARPPLTLEEPAPSETPPIPAVEPADERPTKAETATRSPSRVLPDPDPTPSPLTVELDLLRAAAESYDAHNFAAAGSALDRYESQVKNGSLATEAAVLRVLLWCATGQNDLARERAESVARADPGNPAVGRLRASCAAGRGGR